MHVCTCVYLYIQTDRNTHTLKGYRSNVHLSASFGLPLSVTISNCSAAKHCLSEGTVPGLRLSILVKQANFTLFFFFFTLLDLFLILNTLEKFFNTNMNEITELPLEIALTLLLIV